MPRGVPLPWAAARRSAIIISSALLLAVLCWPGQADAQESDDLRSKTQNPVGSLYSVPLENNFDFGAPNGGAYILNIQPGIPEGVPGDGATGIGG